MYVSSLFISLSYLLSLRSISSAPVPQYSLIFNPILDFSPAFEPTVDWNCLQDLYLAGQLATASLSGCTNNEGSESKGLRIAFGNDKNPFASINRLLELKKQQGIDADTNSKSNKSQAPKSPDEKLGELKKFSKEDLDAKAAELMDIGFDITLDSVVNMGSALYNHLFG